MMIYVVLTGLFTKTPTVEARCIKYMKMIG